MSEVVLATSEDCLYCAVCVWSGYPDELVAEEDSDDFIHCPDCGGTEFEEW